MENTERWKDLCALAAKEQDPEKLVELVREIARLLEEKETRVRSKPSSDLDQKHPGYRNPERRTAQIHSLS